MLIDPARRLVVLAIPHDNPAKTTKAKPKIVVDASVWAAMIPKPAIAIATATA